MQSTLALDVWNAEESAKTSPSLCFGTMPRTVNSVDSSSAQSTKIVPNTMSYTPSTEPRLDAMTGCWSPEEAANAMASADMWLSSE